jgi:RimJ/RimL family protein N-acetyltransferase
MSVADAQRVLAIQSNWNVTRMLRMAPFPPTLESTSDWLSTHTAEWMSGTAYRFAVILEQHVIGCADVDEIEADCGSLGYWLDADYWGRGFASEAAECVMNFSIETIGLKNLKSGHAFDNLQSGRVLTKLGFRFVGTTMVWSRSRQAETEQWNYAFSADLS